MKPTIPFQNALETLTSQENPYVSKVYRNTSTNEIITTEDKILIAVKDWRYNFERASSWKSNLGFFFGCFGIYLTFIGLEFQSLFGVSKHSCQIISLAFSLLFLSLTFYSLFLRWKHRNELNESYLIKKLKNEV